MPGINFRATATFVIDGTDETYALGDGYPTTRGGYTFGWAAGDTSGRRDRNASLDRRLAGVDQQANTGTQRTFQFDLWSSGQKYVRLAIGDATSAQGYQYVQILDDTTPLLTVDDTNGTGGAVFDDTAGTGLTPANWVLANAEALLAFSTATLKMKVGSPVAQAGSSTIAHLFVGDVAFPPMPRPPFLGSLFVGPRLAVC